MSSLSPHHAIACTLLSVLTLLALPHLTASFGNHFIANNTYPLANDTSPVPPYYHTPPHHYTYNNNTQNITYPAPNQTHPHPVPQYWMPDSSFITVGHVRRRRRQEAAARVHRESPAHGGR